MGASRNFMYCPFPSLTSPKEDSLYLTQNSLWQRSMGHDVAKKNPFKRQSGPAWAPIPFPQLVVCTQTFAPLSLFGLLYFPKAQKEIRPRRLPPGNGIAVWCLIRALCVHSDTLMPIHLTTFLQTLLAAGCATFSLPPTLLARSRAVRVPIGFERRDPSWAPRTQNCNANAKLENKSFLHSEEVMSKRGVVRCKPLLCSTSSAADKCLSLDSELGNLHFPGLHRFTLRPELAMTQSFGG